MRRVLVAFAFCGGLSACAAQQAPEVAGASTAAAADARTECELVEQEDATGSRIGVRNECRTVAPGESPRGS